MKTAAIAILFLIAVFLLWRLNSVKRAPFEFSGQTLHLHSGACSIDLPTYGQKDELVDVLEISRRVVKLPNGSTLLYESVDFPATYDFSFPPDAVVAKVFGFTGYSVEAETRHISVIKGKDSKGRVFSVLAVPEIGHRLEMLYPLDEETASIFVECLVKGMKKGFSNPSGAQEITLRPDWSESEIVKQNMIEKDM